LLGWNSKAAFLAFCALFVLANAKPEFSVAAETTLPATEPGVSASPSEISRIAGSETWLRLVHADRRSSSSAAPGFSVEVVSDGFYLTETDDFDPEQELIATLKLLNKASDVSGNQSPLCRYPARYLWLDKGLGHKRPGASYAQCKQLSAWADFANIDSLNLVHVSGYFGNPASAFGHLLLRVNKRGQTGKRGLLDLGFNYGASIPDGESTLLYIVKGITGGYIAGFSDASFYAQDHVYSSVENRDMWAHKLNLSDFQIRFLLYHLWELRQAKFDYFFLKNNCAFHMAQLLELVLDRSFNLERRPWYPPIAVFHRLAAIDQEHQKAGEELIADIAFIPSHQRELYSAFNTLKGAEQSEVQSFIAQRDPTIYQSTQSAPVLDFLLQYIDYKVPPEAPDEPDEPDKKHNEPGTVLPTATEELPDPLIADRQAILATRMRLPAGTGASADSGERYAGDKWAAPLLGPRPGKFVIGFDAVHDGDTSGVMEFAPYSYDALQRNKGSLTDSSLELLNTRLRFGSGELVLERLDLLRIEKLTANATRLKGERRPAWRVGFGIEQPAARCDSCLRGFARGSIGYSYVPRRQALLFGFANIGADYAGADLSVTAGVIYRPTGTLSLRLQSDGVLIKEGSSELDLPLWTHSVSGLWSVARDIDIAAQGLITDGEESLRLSGVLRF